MTRTGPAKKVDRTYVSGRLANARAYLQAARDGLAFTGAGSNANPVISHIVTAAIAFTDALMASRKALVNRQDHGAAVKLLREAFGRELPAAQERRLRRLLERKDEVQYGPSAGRRTDAERMLTDLEAFASWAERQFVGR